MIALRDLAAFIHLDLLIHLSYTDSEGVFTPSVKGGPGWCANTRRGLGHRLREQGTTVTVFNTSVSHAITPLAGSIRDGAPADLTKPTDYPIEAVCLECGQPIRCERYYLAG